MQDPVKNGRVYYYDILRALACMMVVMIHVTSRFSEAAVGSVNFFVGNLINLPCRIAVPLFIMLSGALMLDESYACTSKKVLKHILKIVVFYVFWSLFFALYTQVEAVLVHHRPFSPHSLLAAFFAGHYHLWFCFMIVGLYLIVPLLRLWVKDENCRTVEYFMLLAFLSAYFLPKVFSIGGTVFPFLANAQTVLNQARLKYVGGYTLYFILGWYLSRVDLFSKRISVGVFFGGFAVWYGLTVRLSFARGEVVKLHDYISVFPLVCAVAVFSFVKACFGQKSASGRFLSRAVQFISRHSFGVYGVHPLFISLSLLLPFPILQSVFFGTPVLFVSVFSLALAVSFLFSKVPLLKKVV